MDLPAYREENLAKRPEENDKKFDGEPCPIRRERKVWKTFWKVSLNKSNSDFKKTCFTIFDWSKIKFDWLKQTEASLKILKQFWLIEKQIGSIETDRGSLNFLRKKTQFLKITKTHFRHLKALKFMNKMHEYVMQCILKTTVLNPVFPKLRSSNVLH